MANTYKNKVVLADGTILIDLTQDTVTSASDIISGKVGHLADGSIVTGTASGGGIDGNDLEYGLSDRTLPIVNIGQVDYAVI